MSSNARTLVCGAVIAGIVWAGGAPASAAGPAVPVPANARPPSGVPAASHGKSTITFSTDASHFTPGVPNQGVWHENNADLMMDDANYSYFVGRCCGWMTGEYRNFFTFDVSSLRRPVRAASLRLDARAGGMDPVETYRLSDVTTPAAVLNYNADRNRDVFDDLGNGTIYGEYEISRTQDGTWLDLPLSPAAVEDINRARGRGFFSLGGSLLTANNPIPEDGSQPGNEFLFGSGGAIQSAILVLTPR